MIKQAKSHHDTLRDVTMVTASIQDQTFFKYAIEDMVKSVKHLFHLPKTRKIAQTNQRELEEKIERVKAYVDYDTQGKTQIIGSKFNKLR